VAGLFGRRGELQGLKPLGGGAPLLGGAGAGWSPRGGGRGPCTGDTWLTVLLLYLKTVNNVELFLFVGHFISCVSWVRQSRSLRFQLNIYSL